MHGDGRLFLEALREVVPLEKPGHSVAAGKPDDVLKTHGVEPLGVEPDLRSLRIENLEYLGFVGLGVLLNFFPRHRRSGDIAACRIADQAGHVADQENHGVPQILKVLHLAEQHGMAEMQIRRGRVESCFYAKRAA